MSNIKKLTILALIAILTITVMAGCGKKKDSESTNTNIVRKETTENADNNDNSSTTASERPKKEYEVVLDERDEKAKYTYSIDDISFIDTVNGKKVSVGMTMDELEAVTGKSLTDDKNYRVYDGLIVQFSDEGKAVSMIVSGGMFPNDDQATRYMSVRGVGINTSFDDFSKAYGDIYTKAGEGSADAPANAMRYFKVKGDSVEYLGNELNDNIKKESDKNKDVYVQYFMFTSEDNSVSAMRVSRYDYLGQ